MIKRPFLIVSLLCVSFLHAAVLAEPTLVEIWKTSLGEAAESSPLVTDQFVVVADVLGRIDGLDRQTGEIRWTKDFDTGFVAAPTSPETTTDFFIGDVEGNVYRIASQSGDVIWKVEVEGEVNASVTFVDDRLLVTSQGGVLRCLNQSDGTEVWNYPIDDQIRCSPVVADGHTFLGGCDGRLHVIDIKTGQSAAQPIELAGPTGSTPAVDGSMAYLPIMDGVLYGLDWKSGTKVWEYADEEQSQEYRSDPVITSDAVLINSVRKNVDSIDRQTGKRRWRYTLRRRSDASPVVVDDTVWIAATDGRLIQLGLNDGVERLSYEVRGEFLASPVIRGNEVYITDDRAVVRRLKLQP